MTVARRLPGRFQVVVMAASLGGISAYIEVLRRLPANFSAAIVLVQHRTVRDDERLAAILGARSALRVVNVRAGDCLEPGVVHVTPAHGQLLIGPGGRVTVAAGRLLLADTVFASAAATYGAGTVGVVLTGSLRDGASGARAIKASGGRVFVQDPAQSQAPGMPLATLAIGCVDHVLPLAGIASALSSFVMAPGAADLFGVPTPHWVGLDQSDAGSTRSNSSRISR